MSQPRRGPIHGSSPVPGHPSTTVSASSSSSSSHEIQTRGIPLPGMVPSRSIHASPMHGNPIHGFVNPLGPGSLVHPPPLTHAAAASGISHHPPNVHQGTEKILPPGSPYSFHGSPLRTPMSSGHGSPQDSPHVIRHRRDSEHSSGAVSRRSSSEVVSPLPEGHPLGSPDSRGRRRSDYSPHQAFHKFLARVVNRKLVVGIDGNPTDTPLKIGTSLTAAREKNRMTFLLERDKRPPNFDARYPYPSTPLRIVSSAIRKRTEIRRRRRGHIVTQRSTGFFIKSDDAALISFKLFATSTVRTFAVTESRNSARTLLSDSGGKTASEWAIQHFSSFEMGGTGGLKHPVQAVYYALCVPVHLTVTICSQRESLDPCGALVVMSYIMHEKSEHLNELRLLYISVCDSSIIWGNFCNVFNKISSEVIYLAHWFRVTVILSTPFSILVSVLFDDMRSRNITHIRCILKVTKLREHWDETNSKVMQRKTQLDMMLGDSQRYEAKRNEVEVWLARMETRLERMRAVGHTADVLEAQLREQKYGLFDGICLSAQALNIYPKFAGANIFRGRELFPFVGRIKESERFGIYLPGRFLSLGALCNFDWDQSVPIGISEEKLRTIYRRKTLVEDLTLPTYQGSSAKEARLLLTRYEAGSFHAELHQYKHHIELFNQLTQKLIAVYQQDDTTRVKKMTETINQRYNNLNTRQLCISRILAFASTPSRETLPRIKLQITDVILYRDRSVSSIINRGKLLHSAMNSLHNFDRSLDKFLAWLSEAESSMEGLEAEADRLGGRRDQGALRRPQHQLKKSEITNVRLSSIDHLQSCDINKQPPERITRLSDLTLMGNFIQIRVIVKVRWKSVKAFTDEVAIGECFVEVSKVTETRKSGKPSQPLSLSRFIGAERGRTIDKTPPPLEYE
ncbi:Dystrophin, isoforms A/C/F/G [Camponotus floridanus]|uniref:Dystrophin, isoforms A/C/F/G n=1 Tax=Camponotus floridanus TaxID=104421 RepID=E2A0Q0_CAMFO|nr:Dystrophin, isoforms A/C/F/G [Camponotus floridanus]